MAATVALYSSSPPSAVMTSTARSSGCCEGELEFGRRSSSNQQTTTMRVRGGLSSLFANSSAKSVSSAGPSYGDSYESSSSATFLGTVQTESTLFSSSRESFDSRPSAAVNIPTASSLRVKDRSPVSVLTGFSCSRTSSPPALATVAWEGTSISSNGLPPLDSHNLALRKRPSLSAEKPLSMGGLDKQFLTGDRSTFSGGPVQRSYGFRVGNDGMEDLAGASSSSNNCGNATTAFQFQRSWTQAFEGDIAINALGLDSVKESVMFNASDKKVGRHMGSPNGASQGSIFTGLEKKKLEEAREQLLRMVEKGTDMEPSRVLVGSDEELLIEVQKKHSIFYDPLVKKAFNVAASAHQGQVRKDGRPYITHCLETAVILAECRLDKVVIAAGMLHDILDDSMMDEDKLRNIFGDKVTDLVVGVSRLSLFSQLARDRRTVSNPLETSRLRHMFISMADARVVLIKLADRLHNLRTLGHLPRVKQLRIAEETLEIFAPIASRLGIWRWKAEIEDICFKYIHPEAHEELSQKLGSGRWQEVKAASAKLGESLKAARIEFQDLDGRPKNLYSVYLKMQKKGRSVDEIFDVRGLRLIMPDDESCYAALDVVHKLWKPVAGDHFKDYIRTPKANGYQSLHTVVQGENGQKVEVQIRTKEMHHQAEYGLAAHWQYKEGEVQHSAAIQQRIRWVRWVLSWQAEFVMDSKLGSLSGASSRAPCPFPNHEHDCPFADDNEGSLFALRSSDCDPHYVIVLEGKDSMAVQEVPNGSTVADVIRDRREAGGVYANHVVRPLVNQEFVDMDQDVHMGDVVELIMEADHLEDMELMVPPLLPLHAVSEQTVGLSVDEMMVELHRQKLNKWFTKGTTSA